MSTWKRCLEEEPPLGDYSVLMHFGNGSIETVHVEDYFRPISDGVDDDGRPVFTKWWMRHEPPCTHWMELPEPPNSSPRS